VPAGAGDVLGLEVSGRVSGFGPDVTEFADGDPVVALLAGGGYAEQVVVPAGQVIPVPDGTDLTAAAGLPEAAATVYSNIFMAAGMKAGEVVLIHGGAGGIGLMATQLVRAFGGRAAVTAGSSERLQVPGSMGADILINYHTEDFVERVRDATDGHGADVVLDIIGAKYLARNIDVLAHGGRLVIIGLQGGRTAEVDLNQVMAKEAHIMGTLLRPRPVREKAAIMGAVREYVWPLLADGTVRMPVDRVFTLDEVQEAHRYFETGAHVGKVLLSVQP